jgi:hypothetical protein
VTYELTREILPRKEVIQPQVPLRLPCYDLAPVTEFTLDGSPPKVRPPASGTPSFHRLTGGVYKARERIHRGIAALCTGHCSTCVALDIRAMMT